MALQRSTTDPSLWEDPGAGAGPGTYAVVIGVSRYHHLPVPDAPPPQPAPPSGAYGLGQLNVSALTAYRFFIWMRDRYRYDSAPLARCWVLLSPTPEEVAQEPELAGYPAATLAECQRALEQWIVSMQGLHPEFLEASRAMFFFSGHGINSGDRQLLLPADWLRPPLFNVNAALTAQNVMGGLRSLPLPEEILFLDACRNRPVQLSGMQLTGTPVLPEVPQSSADPSRVSPLMWASAAGTEAWQPSTPAEGLSLFGTALLEGLDGRVPGDPECVHGSGHIGLYGLGQFVNRRVSQLLRKHGSTVARPIRIGESSDVCITLPAAPSAAGVAPASPPSADPGTRRMRGAGGIARQDDEAAPAAEDPGRWFALPGAGIRPREHGASDLHRFFGSEHLSELWHGARALPLAGAQGAPAEIVVHAVRLAESSLWHVVFSVEGEGAHWLELNDWAHTYAVTLPGDAYLRPRYTLEFSRDADGSFRRVEAGLSAHGPGMLGEMARLWEKYTDLRLREVIGELDAQVFEEALRSKMQSPLCAEVAGLFLLRGRKYERLHHWLGNLARWHPRRTDGPVLWAEHLRQARASKFVPSDQVEQLLQVAERGLPHTAEAMVYLGEQLDEVLRFAFFHRLRHTDEQGRQLLVLLRLRERVNRALAHLRTGGLFAVYAAPRGSLSPELVGPAVAGAASPSHSSLR